MTDICANCKHRNDDWECEKTSPAHICKVTGLRTYKEPLKKCVDVRGDDDKCPQLHCPDCRGAGEFLAQYLTGTKTSEMIRCGRCGGAGVIYD